MKKSRVLLVEDDPLVRTAGGQIDFVITVLAWLRKGQSGEGARS